MLATKKVGKAAALASRKGAVSAASKKPVPKKGDVVWVDGPDVLGIFVRYFARGQCVDLRWPGSGFMSPYVWPDGNISVFHVGRENIQVLSPEQILEKMDWLMKVRDELVRGRIVSFISNNIGTRFFPDL